MTLLASERSMIIRNKFRSVLQLRIQNRRQQNELNAESGTKTYVPDKTGEKEVSNGLHQTEDGTIQKSPPSGLTAQTAPERGYGGAHRQKKARLAEDLSEKIQRQPGPLDLLQRNILPLENTPSLPSDAFEDDNSSSLSASPEQLGMHQSPGFSSSPVLGSDQSLSDASPVAMPISPNSVQCRLALLPATECISQPMTMTVTGSNSISTTGRPKGMYMPSQTLPLLPKHKPSKPSAPPSHSILGGSLTSSRPPRPRKPRDSKPKMRKLKYHQYIPPDQRAGTGNGAGNTSQKNNNIQTPPTDSSYSHFLEQQQVFLQLQIVNQQQQLTVTNSEHQLKISGTTPQSSPQSGTPSASPFTDDTSPMQQAELLPSNLDDLTVSVLRQQLRKRGLPVSGTKPALLERLRPFQVPRPPVTPAPLCQLRSTIEPTHPAGLNQITTSIDTSTNPAQIYIHTPGLAEQSLAGDSYFTSSSAGSSPSIHTHSPSMPSGAMWRPSQAVDELSMELEMREWLRSRPREEAKDTQLCGGSLHSFLQQDSGCSRGKPDTAGQEALFTCCTGDGKVNCCQLCDVIGQDFDLPMQITASPTQASPAVRSLEEEIQEAIQRVQMDPTQSIDDILKETIGCSDNTSPITDLQQSATTVLSGSSPASQPEQSQSSKRQKDDNFLSSPLCSSLLLELPPSPNNAPPLGSTPAPLTPPPICTTPPSSSLSRKRRSEVPAFDPADWLESLTSGVHPLTPCAAPFLESDFGLDSDLNVNRVLELMVEQW
ncbi:myocardin-like [Myxocyprinus asiaticus]|uniref:myocardin-like n=1 Tax=Myxocyprinus asiaticus TaxID=70543 RepID=UPI002222382E|nr:myocardin-like [Myxocyprinus asiaticus]